MPNDRITRRQLLKFGALAAGLAVIGPRPGLAGPDGPQAGPPTPRVWFPAVLWNTTIRYEPVPLPGAAIAKFVEPVTVFGPASGGTNPRVPGFHMKVIAQELQQQVLPAQF